MKKTTLHGLQARIYPRTLHFKQPAGTSRGVYTTRQVWYILLAHPASGRYGVGECAPLPALSCDDRPDYEDVLRVACRRVETTGTFNPTELDEFPSIRFGLETALRHLHAGSLQLWNTPFSQGREGIPINGLIWMGDFDTMYQRIEEKMRLGFRCIKLKIGAINFDQELALLAHIRRGFTREQIELRVDANGAFTPEEASRKLEQLAAFDLHSIEQPIRAGQWQEMAHLCATTPLPIALDEELIGIHPRERKIELLDTIRPQYIILKPSLHGGLYGSEEWMELARERGIGSWVTSALESNIGLNAIAQWCATLPPACPPSTETTRLPQGLGTGLLFTDNIDYPLHIEGDCLCYHPEEAEPPVREWLNTEKGKMDVAENRKDIAGESPHAYCQDAARHAAFRQDVADFIATWQDASPTLEVHTSGSTGTPKRLEVEKKRMQASARLTCSFLGLQAGDSALLCMPVRYIAGKMMVVRALEARLDLWMVTPSGHPLSDLTEAPVFAAMTPMQVYNSLQVPAERALLQQIRHLIIGGGAIDTALAEALKAFPEAVWSTYGMTETLSHIALRRLNGSEASEWYTPFDNVRCRLSEAGTLVIQAPAVCADELTTNDLAEFDPQGRFRILGRRDNTLNSGGIKIQMEEVETALRPHLSRPFLITGAPDEKFGEKVVLLIEDPLSSPSVSAEVEAICRKVLPPYWCPKDIVAVDTIPLTGTGKPDRARARQYAQASRITEA